jgi:hypothetical protein
MAQQTYVIRITGSSDSGYYASWSPYKPVNREAAEKVARKDVDRICSRLRHLGYSVAREMVK